MKKRMFLMLAFALTMCSTMMADNDRVINFDQLPAQALTLLKTHFGDKVPLIVTADRNEFTVMYENGEKVEFDKKGNWKDLNFKMSEVPAELIPEAIKAHVAASFPQAKIIKLDRDRRGYEVKLDNMLELEFNKKFQLIELGD